MTALPSSAKLRPARLQLRKSKQRKSPQKQERYLVGHLRSGIRRMNSSSSYDHLTPAPVSHKLPIGSVLVLSISTYVYTGRYANGGMMDVLSSNGQAIESEKIKIRIKNAIIDHLKVMMTG